MSHRIKSNEYAPNGKSLPYTAPCGMQGTVGVWKPGDKIEVPTKLPEIVQIIRGRAAMTIPGLLERQEFKKHDKFYIPGGQERVIFEALDGNDVAYECIYYEEDLDSEREKTRILVERTMSKVTTSI